MVSLFYANSIGCFDIVRVFPRPIQISDTYSKSSIWTVNLSGPEISEQHQLTVLPRKNEPILILAGLGDPASILVLETVLEIARKRKNKVICLLDPTEAQRERIKSCLTDEDTVLYFEGFRNLKWGMRDPNLPEELHTCLDVCNWNIERVRKSRPSKFIFKTRGVGTAPSRLYILYSILSKGSRLGRFEFTCNVGDRWGKERTYTTKGDYERAYKGVCDYVGKDELPIIQYPGIFRGFWNQEENGGGFIHEDMMVPERPYFWLEVTAETDKIQTEKMFKPMLWAIPCLYLGHPGTITNLHRQGFQTFDKFWDESYDELPYSYERVDAIFKIVDELLAKPVVSLMSLYEEMIPIFRHNAEVLDIVPSYVDEIYDYLDRLYTNKLV